MTLWEGQITRKSLGPKYAWHNEHCTWISVPKNANMMFRKLCTAIGMYKQLRTSLAPISFAVVRDPKTRLFSGICEYMKRSRKPITEASIVDTLIDFRYNSAFFDEHLEPQTVWLHGTAFTHLVRFENMIEDTMRIPYLHANAEKVLKAINPVKLKRSKHYIDMGGFVVKYSELLDSTVEKYYQQDMDLFNNIRSYENKEILVKHI